MKNSFFPDAANLFEYSGTLVADDPFLSVADSERILSAVKQGELCCNLRFQLINEAYLLKCAYANNKLLSLSNSRTKILAHQVESTYIVVNTLNHRYILADEVGLGKTVEAGLIIKELIYRNGYSRILVAAPASLLVQWQHEMEEKFGESFDILDRKHLDRRRSEISPGENPWNTFSKVICSLDFIKNPRFREELEASSWDMIIFDEAHRLRRDATSTTILYSAAEVLSERTKALLLLTATPFRGKLEELYYIVRLVDKNLLGPYQSFANSYCGADADLSALREKLATVLLRRTKNEIGGFTRRHARTIRFELYPEERELYEETSRYVAEEFNRAMQTQNRAVGFIMTVFQKLLDSSSYALHCALKNRRASLQARLDRANGLIQLENNFLDSIEIDELRDDIEDPLEIDQDTVMKTAEELKEEIRTLDRLITLSGSIRRNKKGDRLKKMIRGLKKDGHTKFLIFTQFRTTQDYIKEILRDYKVDIFNGSMDKNQKEAAIESFKGDVEVLICTEAGGEGRNMQFCNILFNYDLPWSPLKIEQRIGRLHRFGQKHDVLIYNFSTKDTVAERVLDVLEHKLHLFEESIGSPDIMLGQIEDELNLGSLFMKIGSGRMNNTESSIIVDGAVSRARKSFEKLNTLTLTTKMDFNYDDYYRITQVERKYSNEQLEQFMMHYASFRNTVTFASTDVDHVYEVVVSGESGPSRSSGTFYSETALSRSNVEFLAFGHPLIDSAIEDCTGDEFAGAVSIKAVRGEVQCEGILFTFLVTFYTSETTRLFIPVFSTFNAGLSDFEWEEIEEQAILKPAVNDSCDPAVIERVTQRVVPYTDELYSLALERLKKRTDDVLFDMKEGLDLQIDPEVEKIRTSYGAYIAELEEKLERQKLRMKTEEPAMKPAVTRTRNRIDEAKRERDHLIAKCRRMGGVRMTVRAISGAVLIVV
ncbi:MAG: DEAD/DEAH box helicase [Spirochaetota bacterium]